MSKKSHLTREMEYKSAIKALDDSMRPRRMYNPNADEGRTQASGREMDALEKLVLLDAVMNIDEAVLRPRLSGIKNGWRDYKMVASVIHKLVENVLETCTVRTLEKLEYMAKHCEIQIKPKSVTPVDHCVVVHESALMQLVNIVGNAECAICFKQGAEVKGCKLRKTLMEIAPLNDLDIGERCGYADIMLEGGIDG